MSGGVITFLTCFLLFFSLWFFRLGFYGLLATLARLFLSLWFGLWFSLFFGLFLCFFALGYLTEGKPTMTHGANVEKHARVNVL